MVLSRFLSTSSRHLKAIITPGLVGRMAFYSTTSPEILQALERFSSCEISDALVKLKVPSGGLIPHMISFGGSHSSSTRRLIGEIFTVKIVDVKETEAPKLQGGHFIDQAPPGSIVFISTPHHIKCASLGGLLAAGLHVKGVKGVVIDGHCRDLDEIEATGLPVFAKGHSTLGQSPWTRPSSVQQTLSIVYPDWPEIRINPHDILMADKDGVVVIPAQLLDQVLQNAEIGKEVDDKCMKDILAGKGVKETFDLHRGTTKKH